MHFRNFFKTQFYQKHFYLAFFVKKGKTEISCEQATSDRLFSSIGMITTKEV